MLRDRAAAVIRLVGSVGTDHHPFPRFLEWVAAAEQQLGVEAMVQRGATPELAGLTTVDYLPAEDLLAAMDAADVVVCHGGPGTIAAAIRCGHTPIVIARDPLLGEHVDDHQQRYTRKLRAGGSIELPADLPEFLSLVAAVQPRDVAALASSVEAAAAEITRSALHFGELVDELLAGRAPRRRWRDRVLVRRVP